MITLEILDYKKNFVKQWPWEDRKPIPNKGDTMLIHFGDNNEVSRTVKVIARIFDGTRPDMIYLTTDYENERTDL